MYGPWATNISSGEHNALFRVQQTTNNSSTGNVLNLDVYDATDSKVLALRTFTEGQLPSSLSNASVPFYNPYPNHALEFRAYWFGTETVNIDKVTVQHGFSESYEAEASYSYHQTGSQYASGSDVGWQGILGVHSSGTLVYGPYAIGVPEGRSVASFKLMVDRTNSHVPVASIDVSNYTTGIVLATRTLYADDFNAPNVYQEFSLPFTKGTAKDQLEFRTRWNANSYLRVDRVIVNRDW